ncbi:hypothetical protein [Pseudovibrio sp. WM33]|uniref:hypothetical protein n=1 Tax=Pseudovibrio sp. WM33 TaxID=1735585 RepID=UPI0007AED820|nr:hypothetical protein [Pseudovibrio sp. WM33]KZL25438.1 hypothetical protein PsWM33_01988 [Pseudovibrio sp. WM33]
MEAIAEVKQAGNITDEQIMRQLMACGSSESAFNFWHLFISPVFANSNSCTLQPKNGEAIFLIGEETEAIWDVYLAIAANDPSKIEEWTWLKDGALSAPIRALGVMQAIYDGPVQVGTDENGEPLYLSDNQGRLVYTNTYSGEVFAANPMDPSDSSLIGAAVDIAGLAGSGTTFTPIKLPKVAVGSINDELDNLINSGVTNSSDWANSQFPEGYSPHRR